MDRNSRHLVMSGVFLCNFSQFLYGDFNRIKYGSKIQVQALVLYSPFSIFGHTLIDEQLRRELGLAEKQ